MSDRYYSYWGDKKKPFGYKNVKHSIIGLSEVDRTR